MRSVCAGKMKIASDSTWCRDHELVSV